MPRSRLVLFLLVLALAPAGRAHVGSPDVYYDAMAGPYHLFVTVRTPQMIPGIAFIEVRALDAAVTALDIVPLRIIGEGSENAPPPDRMEQSKSDPQFFTGKLWLMESGSWQVRLNVHGSQGQAEMAVPVAAFARRTLAMQKVTGIILTGLMVFLALSLVAIFGAASRESQLDAGASPAPQKRRSARFVMAATVVALLAILFLGNLWWDAEANARATGMIYKAPPMQASLVGANQLQLKLGFSSWHDRRKQLQLVNLIPDHGHLMHLFLVRMPQMDRFYHLHPDQTSADTFTDKLSAIDGGSYSLFADIVRESGFPDTMTTQLTLPDVSTITGSSSNMDDSASLAQPISNGAPNTVASLADAGKAELLLNAQTIQAQKPVILRFRITDKNGKPAADLELYMGMAGHLVILRRDLSVFAHVHPAGSVPMAAVALLENPRSASPDPMAGMHHGAVPSEITFPYGFPQPGEYRLFLQVKPAGQVKTAVFDVNILP